MLVTFLAKLDKIESLEKKDELKGYLQLCQAKLGGHDRNIIIGSAGTSTQDESWQLACEMLIVSKA